MQAFGCTSTRNIRQCIGSVEYLWPAFPVIAGTMAKSFKHSPPANKDTTVFAYISPISCGGLHMLVMALLMRSYHWVICITGLLPHSIKRRQNGRFGYVISVVEHTVCWR